MSAAPLELVWDSLVDAIEGITTHGGYRTTVHHVTTEPTTLIGQSSQQTPAVVLMYDADRSTIVPSAMGDVVDDTLVFLAEWRIDCPGLTDADKRQAISDWHADIEKAVCADASRGGVAWETDIAPGPGGPWIDASGVILGTHTITVYVSRVRGAA